LCDFGTWGFFKSFLAVCWGPESSPELPISSRSTFDYRYSLVLVSVTYQVLLWLGILVALVFSVLVILTGKGDAMSGGGSIRTSYKGKASFDDQVSNWTLYLGATFMVLMLAIDFTSRFLPKK